MKKIDYVDVLGRAKSPVGLKMKCGKWSQVENK